MAHFFKKKNIQSREPWWWSSWIVVNEIAFYSNNSSSNPTEVYRRTKINKAGLGWSTLN